VASASRSDRAERPRQHTLTCTVHRAMYLLWTGGHLTQRAQTAHNNGEKTGDNCIQYLPQASGPTIPSLSSPIRLARIRSDTFPSRFIPVGSRGHGGMLTASLEGPPPASRMHHEKSVHPFIKLGTHVPSYFMRFFPLCCRGNVA